MIVAALSNPVRSEDSTHPTSTDPPDETLFDVLVLPIRRGFQEMLVGGDAEVDEGLLQDAGGGWNGDLAAEGFSSDRGLVDDDEHQQLRVFHGSTAESGFLHWAFCSPP